MGGCVPPFPNSAFPFAACKGSGLGSRISSGIQGVVQVVTIMPVLS